MNKVMLGTLEEAKQELSRIQQGEVRSVGTWSAYEMLAHCAQTIEYAMSGYPVMKPKVVRSTIGRVAIRKFLKQGYMKHSLTAHVPGAHKPEGKGTAQEGAALLAQVIDSFQAYKGPLQPHLLFGNLDKSEYDQYFAMHIADHLSELEYQA